MLYKLEIELKGNSDKRPYAERDYVPLDFDVKQEYGQGKLNWEELPDYEPVFSDVILTPQSKEVDFIKDWGAIQGTGLIVSEDIKQIFSEFILPLHRYYPLRIFHPKKGLLTSPQFYWLQVVTKNYLDIIDFERSSIYMSEELFPEPDQKQKVNSKEMYLELKEKFFSATYDTIYMKEKLAYDLFYLNEISNTCYISQKLKSRFDISDVSGIRTFENEIDVLL